MKWNELDKMFIKETKQSLNSNEIYSYNYMYTGVEQNLKEMFLSYSKIRQGKKGEDKSKNT